MAYCYHDRMLNLFFDFQRNSLRIARIRSYYTKASDSVMIMISYSSGLSFFLAWGYILLRLTLVHGFTLPLITVFQG